MKFELGPMSHKKFREFCDYLGLAGVVEHNGDILVLRWSNLTHFKCDNKTWWVERTR